MYVQPPETFESLVPIDGYYPAGPGPDVTPEKQEIMYRHSTCMTCGCCLESCPQYNSHSPFHRTRSDRSVSAVLYSPYSPSSLSRAGENPPTAWGCCQLRQCAKLCPSRCPKKIPLTDAIAAAGDEIQLFRRSVTFRATRTPIRKHSARMCTPWAENFN